MRPLILLALSLLVAAPAAGQQVDIRATPPPRVGEPQVIAPGLGDVTRPSDLDHYPRTNGVRHDPAFIAPLSAKRVTPTSTGRVGVSAWTSPNTPVGAPVSGGFTEVTGWLGFGISFTWDGPPETTARSR